MIEYIKELHQGTPEWLATRCGLITASEVDRVITEKKLELSKGKGETVYPDYLFQKAAERYTGRVTKSFSSFDMDRGSFEEPLARDLYEQNYQPVDECGFIRDAERKIGFSPDGLTGDGFIEIKCRDQKFQMETFYIGKTPLEYMMQIQFGLYVSGLKYCDFIQYSNGMALFVDRVFPDIKYFCVFDAAIPRFNASIDGIVNKMIESSKNCPVAQYLDYDINSDIEV